jgi:hypothetical protein
MNPSDRLDNPSIVIKGSIAIVDDTIFYGTGNFTESM